MAKLSKFEKLAIIGADIALAVYSVPAGLSMLPAHLHLAWLLSVAWLFMGIPTILLIADKLDKSTKDKEGK